jgi:hypothetical protein
MERALAELEDRFGDIYGFTNLVKKNHPSADSMPNPSWCTGAVCLLAYVACPRAFREGSAKLEKAILNNELQSIGSAQRYLKKAADKAAAERQTCTDLLSKLEDFIKHIDEAIETESKPEHWRQTQVVIVKFERLHELHKKHLQKLETRDKSAIDSQEFITVNGIFQRRLDYLRTCKMSPDIKDEKIMIKHMLSVMAERKY